MNNRSQTSYQQVPYKTIFEEIPDATQYITFELSNYRFAIPSYEILRVVATPPASQGGLVSLGLVQLGPYSIQIVDITTLLSLKGAADKDNPRPSVSSSRVLEKRKQADDDLSDQNPPFLIVLQSVSQENLWGIALSEPPDLIEVPDYALKPVPAQKRLSRSLRWVSHIVSYDLNRDRHSLLILDLSPILESKEAEDFTTWRPKVVENQPSMQTDRTTLKGPKAQGSV